MRRSTRSTPRNFNELQVAWRFKTDNLGPRLEFDFQSTPLVVNGTSYSTGVNAGRKSDSTAGRKSDRSTRGRASVCPALLTSRSPAAAAAAGFRLVRRVQGLPELRVLPHAVAVAANRDEVTVMHEAIDQCRRHHVVAEDVTPLLETLVGRQRRRRVLVATPIGTGRQ